MHGDPVTEREIEPRAEVDAEIEAEVEGDVEAEVEAVVDEVEEIVAEASTEDDQDKAPAATGAPIDPGDRRLAIGVDVGGSGIKAALVDLDTGELISPRHRVPTASPRPSRPPRPRSSPRSRGSPGRSSTR